MTYSVINNINLGLSSNKVSVNVTLNRKNKDLCVFLFSHNFIASYFCNYKKNQITVFFSSFYEKKTVVRIKQISKPSRPVHVSYKMLKKNKHIFFIISTDKGLISTKEALTNKIGGELLF